MALIDFSIQYVININFFSKYSKIKKNLRFIDIITSRKPFIISQNDGFHINYLFGNYPKNGIELFMKLNSINLSIQ